MKNGTFVSQGKYIKDMLKKFGMDHAKVISVTPQVLSLHFSLALHEHKCHPFFHELEHMKFYFIHSMFITCDT